MPLTLDWTCSGTNLVIGHDYIAYEDPHKGNTLKVYSAHNEVDVALNTRGCNYNDSNGVATGVKSIFSEVDKLNVGYNEGKEARALHIKALQACAVMDPDLRSYAENAVKALGVSGGLATPYSHNVR